MPTVDFPFKPGIVSKSDQSALVSEGRYVEGDKVRFRRVSDKTLPEVMKGYEDLFDHDTGGYLEGKVRALHVYLTLDGQNQVIAGSDVKLYAYSGALLWPITPIRSSGSLSGPLSVTSGSAVVTITAASHGCLEGDRVFFYNPTAVGGISLGANGSANNAITASANSRSLVISLTGHGMATGSRITISGASAVAGIPASEINKKHTIYKVTDDIIQIQTDTKATSDAGQTGGSITWTAMKEYSVASVVDANTITVTASANASSTASGGGSTTYEFEIQSGKASTAKSAGYSSSTYSTGFYSMPSSETDLDARVWTLDNQGEVLIASYSESPLFKWENNPSQRAVNLASSVTDCVDKVITHVCTPERFLVTLGAPSVAGNGSVNADFDPLQITWAKIEGGTNSGDWTPLEENSAGSLKLGSESRIVAAATMPFQNLIWTRTELFSLQYIPSLDTIFRPTLLASGAGIISKNAWVRAGDSGSVFWLSSSREFMVWSGGSTPTTISCPVKKLFFDNLSPAQEAKIYACGLDSEQEVTWYYPTDESGESENFRFVTLNYAEGHWHTGTMAVTACVQRGLEEFSIAAWAPEAGQPGSTLKLMEKSNTANGNAIPGVYLETGWIDAQEGENSSMISRYTPDWLTNSSINVKLISKMWPQATTTITTDLGSINSTTLKKDFRITARQFKIKYEWSSVAGPTDGRQGRTLLDIKPTTRTR